MAKSKIAALQAALAAFISENELGKVKFYSKQDWNDRGEEYGTQAALTMTIEESDLYSILNGYSHIPSYQDKLTALVEEHGYWWELGYAWSVHFYRKEA